MALARRSLAGLLKRLLGLVLPRPAEPAPALELAPALENQSLLYTNVQLSAVVEAALSAIIAVDNNGIITLFNAEAENLTGYCADEVIHKQTPLIFHLPEEIAARGRELSHYYGREISGMKVFHAVPNGGIKERREWTYVRKDGSHISVCLNVSAVRDESGNVTGFMGVAYDEKSKQFGEESLAIAKEAAESANRAKSEFLATMSHEIRTPMNGIIGMAQLLLCGDLDPQQRKHAETLRDSAEAVLVVLNDILDFSKIEANKLELEITDFNLRVLVEGVADLLALKAQEKGLELVCFIDYSVPTRVCGDPTRLRQILVNLVVNAIKFTPAGEVTLRVTLQPDAQLPLVRFEVIDSGIGIPPEKHHLLFERFSQAHSGAARQFGGTGLGLSIAKGLARILGGEIGFTSAAGKGSTFWFTAALQEQAAGARSRPLSLAGKRVLVVDDNRASRAAILQWLSFWQCEGEEAGDSASALARVGDRGKKQFDAILIDLGMPDLSGDRIGAMMRKNPALDSTTLILLTELRHRCGLSLDNAGDFDAQVAKPLKQTELGSALASVLGYGPPKRRPEAVSRETSPGKREIRPQSRLLVVEDNPTNQTVAGGILEHLGFAADIVTDGAAALSQLARLPYTLVLTDCEMPGMDGFELTRMLRNSGTHSVNRDIPIIAMTAHASSGYREKCLTAGMNDFVSKPIQMKVLEEVLNRWIGKTGNTAAACSSTLQMVAPATESAGADFAEEDLIERMMGNEDLARSIVGSFLDGMPAQLAALAAAVNQFDAVATAAAAHALKGAAANVGAQAIQAAASELERLGKAGNVSSANQVLAEINRSLSSAEPAMRHFCRS